MSDEEQRLISVKTPRFTFNFDINVTTVTKAIFMSVLSLVFLFVIDSLLLKPLLGISITGGITQFFAVPVGDLVAQFFYYFTMQTVLLFLLVAVVSAVVAYAKFPTHPCVFITIANIKEWVFDQCFSIPITSTRNGQKFSGDRRVVFKGLRSLITHRYSGEQSFLAKSVEETEDSIVVDLTPTYGLNDVEILVLGNIRDDFNDEYLRRLIESITYAKIVNLEVKDTVSRIVQKVVDSGFWADIKSRPDFSINDVTVSVQAAVIELIEGAGNGERDVKGTTTDTETVG